MTQKRIHDQNQSPVSTYFDKQISDYVLLVFSSIGTQQPSKHMITDTQFLIRLIRFEQEIARLSKKQDGVRAQCFEVTRQPCMWRIKFLEFHQTCMIDDFNVCCNFQRIKMSVFPREEVSRKERLPQDWFKCWLLIENKQSSKI